MPPTLKPIVRQQACQKRVLSRCIGRTKGGLNSKLHAVCNGEGRLILLLLSPGQMSDYKGAAQFLDALPNARELLADRGYDADWFRTALLEKGITACIPPRKTRKTPVTYDKDLYKQRHKIENMFCRIKDWRRIAMPMTGVRIRSFRPFASQLSLFSILINES